MTVKHLLSLADVGREQLSRLVDLSLAMASDKGLGARPLEGKVVGIYFRGPSTRTRTAFTVAAHRLGARVVAYGPTDLQISTGETIHDTARVLSGFLDFLVIRTNGSMDEMRTFASQDEMAVVNAMSDTEHPTQAIADLVTIKEALGQLRDVHVLYVGEGNNTASALALAVSLTRGMRLTLATPAGYGLPDGVLEAAANRNGSVIEQIHDPAQLPCGVDVVYATRWQTMGVPKAEPDWKEKFRPYSVTSELMMRVSKPSGTIFLHDLPAVRGVDVTDDVLDGPQSLAFRQAQHKLSSAMAVLVWCGVPD